jgi:hypothetical protein
MVLALQAGYRFTVALQAFCPSCRRTVYVDDGGTPVCPVCSSALLETLDGDEVVDQTTGTKYSEETTRP